jgi:hypothetical protein
MSQLYFWLTIALTTITLMNCSRTAISNQTEDNNTYFNFNGVIKVRKYHGLKLCGQALTEAMSAACYSHSHGYNKRSAYLYNKFSKYNMTEGLKKI